MTRRYRWAVPTLLLMAWLAAGLVNGVSYPSVFIARAMMGPEQTSRVLEGPAPSSKLGPQAQEFLRRGVRAALGRAHRTQALIFTAVWAGAGGVYWVLHRRRRVEVGVRGLLLCRSLGRSQVLGWSDIIWLRASHHPKELARVRLVATTSISLGTASDAVEVRGLLGTGDLFQQILQHGRPSQVDQPPGRLACAWDAPDPGVVSATP